MENNEEVMTFKVMSDEGKEVECEVLFTFESEENKKNYIVYTDNTIDEEGNTKVYASIYNPNESETKLLPIETEKEWKIIETILEEIQSEANNENISSFVKYKISSLLISSLYLSTKPSELYLF